MKSTARHGELSSSPRSQDEPVSLPPGAVLRRNAFISRTVLITSKSLGLLCIPKDFSAGQTARHMVFSVRPASATTRLADKGSSPRATHSAEA